MKTIEIALITLVVLLLAVSAVQAYQITALNTKATAIATGNFKVNSSGSTDGFSSTEEMMAAHHGGAAQSSAAAAPAQGIGGCG